ncbi:MAG: ligase-associated DNA damage response DEXH box helicase [Planctomycetota bacterium]|nr:ligase-associated DNA damage response DEXH box helicase [Planctomycetota bacterium]
MPVAGLASGLAQVESWFGDRGWTPFAFQRSVWDAHQRGQSGLIQVPTGAGKTYAAFMGALAQTIDGERISPSVSGLQILYVTPLRAVSRDIELALREPTAALAPHLLVESRTGDTATSIRARQKNRLPHVLITTPESLSLLLTRDDCQAQFASLRCIILDEWHELLGTKRGTQTELALSRVRGMVPRAQTWALSATLSNPQEAALAACGGGSPILIHAEIKRQIVVDSVIPADMRRLPLAGHLGLAMLPDLLDSLDPAQSTLVFTNTRSQAERWYHAILAARPQWTSLMALHHGSIDRAEREAVESGLKSGSLRIVVATSSLDLGVDFAPVERVVQIGSPKGIGRLIQRAGRSGHRPGAACRVTCVPTHGLELLEIDAARREIAAGNVEPRTPSSKPLDVLAQHLVTRAMGGGFSAADLYEEVRGAWSYRNLTQEEFDWALALVERGGDTLAAYPSYHRIRPVDGTYQVTDDRIARMHRLNIGTIVSDSTIELRYLSGRSLGRIEEHFVGHLRIGEKFVFAGKVVSFAMMKDMTAYVKPARGKTSHTPIWSGTKLPISENLGAAVRDSLARAANPATADSAELRAASGIAWVQSQSSRIPAAHELLIETCQSREGSHAFIFPFDGRLVHGGLAAVLALRLSRLQKATFSIAVNDYGFELLSPVPAAFNELITPELFDPTGLADDAAASMNHSALARLQFREIARISGLITQTYPGMQKSARQTQASAGLLFDVLTEFDPQNMLLVQARREVLDRHFEHSRLARCMQRLHAAALVHVQLEKFTPLSFPLVVERQAALVSSQTILERVTAQCNEWGL